MCSEARRCSPAPLLALPGFLFRFHSPCRVPIFGPVLGTKPGEAGPRLGTDQHLAQVGARVAWRSSPTIANSRTQDLLRLARTLPSRSQKGSTVPSRGVRVAILGADPRAVLISSRDSREQAERRAAAHSTQVRSRPETRDSTAQARQGCDRHGPRKSWSNPQKLERVYERSNGKAASAIVFERETWACGHRDACSVRAGGGGPWRVRRSLSTVLRPGTWPTGRRHKIRRAVPALSEVAAAHGGVDLALNAAVLTAADRAAFWRGPIVKADFTGSTPGLQLRLEPRSSFWSRGRFAVEQGGPATLVQVTGGSGGAANQASGLWSAGAFGVRPLPRCGLELPAVGISGGPADRRRPASNARRGPHAPVLTGSACDPRRIADAASFLANQDARRATTPAPAHPLAEAWTPSSGHLRQRSKSQAATAMMWCESCVREFHVELAEYLA